MIGPKPRWARQDGGEAGLHPSNIHDNAYAVGAIDFTGDMPIILGPDGPSCGGFVCPATIIAADLWKIGQLRPGDKVRFVAVTAAEARLREVTQEAEIETLRLAASIAGRAEPSAAEKSTQSAKSRSPARQSPPSCTPPPPAATRLRSATVAPATNTCLIEYGPLVLDLDLRFRVHALQQWLQLNHTPGLLDLTPGIRSLQVHYDSRVLPLERLMETLLDAEAHLPAADDMEVPSRIVHLPLSWEDESTLLAIRKYMQTVRKDAPWCPSNIEFIRRINGLDSVDDVKRIAFDASYLVYAFGDVYLGAPVATPYDPRHRLVTTKYNPARTWTPENAVGIGGAYLCIYGMEGPGGYQFIGRTIQMWNRWRQTADFTDGKPWLLRFFDQIRFYEVSAAELLQLARRFPARPLASCAPRKRRCACAIITRSCAPTRNRSRPSRRTSSVPSRRSATVGRFQASSTFPPSPNPPRRSVTRRSFPTATLRSSRTSRATSGRSPSQVGQRVTADQPVVILESMKMEISVVRDRPG